MTRFLIACLSIILMSPMLASPDRLQGAPLLQLSQAPQSAPTVPLLEDLGSVRVLASHLNYPTLPETELKAFTQYLIQLFDELQLPGAAFSIIQGADVVIEETLGQRSLAEPGAIDTETLFNIGPATGAFSSLLAASLDGKSGFNDQKQARLIWPRFRMSNATSAATVTISELFTMTAGIPSYIDDMLDPVWARPDDVFEAIAQAPVIASPGQVFEPSSVSLAAAGYLTGLAAVRNQGFYKAYTQAVQERLFAPIGMNQATFSWPNTTESTNVAMPHTNRGTHCEPTQRWEPRLNAMAPAIGLKASLKDMERWLITELQLGLTPKGQRIASELSIKARWKPAQVKASESFGMGWTRRYYQGIEIIASMGSYDNQSAAIGLFPAYRTGFVVLVNTNYKTAAKFMQEIGLGLAELLATHQ